MCPIRFNFDLFPVTERAGRAAQTGDRPNAYGLGCGTFQNQEAGKGPPETVHAAGIATRLIQSPFINISDTWNMPRVVPAAYHLDFYRYWQAKRGGRAVPARSDIDPAEIPALLPYLGIIEKTDGEFRYRLIGSALVEDLGRDVTGKPVGCYIQARQALRGTVELVYTAARPVFNTARYEFKRGLVHRSSVLLLPLAQDGAAVNMVIFLRLVRFQASAWADRGWLKDAPAEIGEPAFVEDAAHLEQLVLAWERTSPANNAAAQELGELFAWPQCLED